ncbi:MAG: hypothetical protein KGY66_07695 [Candidatus Thermoplasmatota archaeon]|nr:hypothetical protein [Candidatus Thermoplasmatota archaeon]
MLKIDEEKAQKMVYDNTRKELNEMAREEGVKEPEELPRKMSVAKEILRARKVKKFVKKPTGLYIDE